MFTHILAAVFQLYAHSLEHRGDSKCSALRTSCTKLLWLPAQIIISQNSDKSFPADDQNWTSGIAPKGTGTQCAHTHTHLLQGRKFAVSTCWQKTVNTSLAKEDTVAVFYLKTQTTTVEDFQKPNQPRKLKYNQNSSRIVWNYKNHFNHSSG